MQTFVAQFVRPTGEPGVLQLTAGNSLAATLEVFITQGHVQLLSVQKQRRAALLMAPPPSGAADEPSSQEPRSWKA